MKIKSFHQRVLNHINLSFETVSMTEEIYVLIQRFCHKSSFLFFNESFIAKVPEKAKKSVLNNLVKLVTQS